VSQAISAVIVAFCLGLWVGRLAEHTSRRNAAYRRYVEGIAGRLDSLGNHEMANNLRQMADER
jgi:hypothetical protein